MSNPQMNQPVKKREDCLACRLTGFGVFTGVGVYALYDAQRKGTFKTIRPGGSPLIAGKAQAIVGFVMISLGIGRLILPA